MRFRLFLFLLSLTFIFSGCPKEKDTKIKCETTDECYKKGENYCGSDTKVVFQGCENGTCVVRKYNDCLEGQSCVDGVCEYNTEPESETIFCQNIATRLECEEYESCIHSATSEVDTTADKWELAINCAKSATTCEESNQCWSYLFN
ncbi:hypothetical protein JXR93_08175 [bacterium]|nr:hypothetical protein [bacterium]